MTNKHARTIEIYNLALVLPVHIYAIARFWRQQTKEGVCSICTVNYLFFPYGFAIMMFGFFPYSSSRCLITY